MSLGDKTSSHDGDILVRDRQTCLDIGKHDGRTGAIAVGVIGKRARRLVMEDTLVRRGGDRSGPEVLLEQGSEISDVGKDVGIDQNLVE